jgi:low temperature requirement protein LtrA
LLLVAGIVVVAVGDGIVLKHPHGYADAASIAVLLGGPALFLVGNLLFKLVTAGWLPLSHLVGLALLAALAPTGLVLSPLLLGAATTLVLVIVAVWETLSLGSTWQHQAEREAHRG